MRYDTTKAAKIKIHYLANLYKISLINISQIILLDDALQVCVS